MLEISWFAFYVLLHLLLATLLLPGLCWLSKRQPSLPAQQMLQLWRGAAILLLLLPAVMLQPWALEAQILPWFQHSLPAVAGQLPQAVILPQSNAAMLPDENFSAVQQLDWPLPLQLVYLLSPAYWMWLLLPLGSLLKLGQLLLSYRATRALRQQAQVIADGLPPCPLPVRGHPLIASAMLVGIRQPVILLPNAYLQRFDQPKLSLILQHEVCHQQQGDLAAYLRQQLLGTLFWWSPAWHCVAAQLNYWRELRCDTLISRQCGDRRAYAQLLLDCGRQTSAQMPAVLVQRWWQQPLLIERIDAVLTPASRFGWWWRSALIVPLLMIASICWLAQQWQLADLPARHVQVRLSQLQPLAQLLQAVARDDRQSVAAQLAAGAPLNIAMPGDGTALMVAARHGNQSLVEALLAAGADPNVASRGDGNALIIAVQRGNFALAKRLLLAGADVNAAVLADETALINASMRGDIAMAALLLSHGAAINLQVRTPLSDGHVWRSALNQARTTEMRQFLLQRGAR